MDSLGESISFSGFSQMLRGGAEAGTRGPVFVLAA